MTMNAAIQLHDPERTRARIELIKATVAKGATDDELELFLHVCDRTGLDPLAKQIYLVKRWDSKLKREIATTQVGIDGFRAIAARTGLYRGQTRTEWCGRDGVWRDCWLESTPPAAARVGVRCEGWPEPLVRVARYASYAQRNQDGQPIRQWANMPDVMLAKCFDEETEILTDQGFQLFSRVTGRVLEVTPEGLKPTDAKPFSQAYEGPMVTLESDDLNFSVTPNHDMVTSEGKIEAGEMFERARTRPSFWIPRSVQGSAAGLAMRDEQIVLAAAYLCDGADNGQSSFKVSVRRSKKIDALRSLQLAFSERNRVKAPAVSPVRTIIPTGHQTVFAFSFADIAPLCRPGKGIDTSALLQLSREQATLLVDAMVHFDGHTQKKSKVRRFYTSRQSHREAFELACVIAGYAVSGWSSRTSDISTRPNFYATVSARDLIPVMRRGRPYNNLEGASRQTTGLELTQSGGRVWCVTVPSGVIVVRRHGFSMLCGNCAEALALRSAFPAQLSGLYTPEEMGQADNPALVVVAEHEPAREQKPASLPQHREVDGPSGAALQLLTGKLRALQTADELAGWIGELEKLHLSDSRLKRSIWEAFKVHAKALGHDSRDLAVLAARRKAQPAPAPEATPDVDHTVPMPSEPRVEYDAETGEVSP